MLIVKRIDRGSVAKMTAWIMGVMTAVFCIPAALFALMAGGELDGMGAGFLLLIPVIYFVMGYIGGWLNALIYNFAASKIGGIKIETETVK